MLRKLFEDNSPLRSPLPSPKRQKRGKSETPGETALVILRSTGGNAERALGGAWGTPAEFVQLLARCGN